MDSGISETLKQFYHRFEYVERNSTVKLTASCKKCSRTILCNWKPQRVTSNFISHVRICSPTAFGNYEKENKNKPRKRTCLDETLPVAKCFKVDIVDRSEFMTESITKYLIISARHVSEVESDGFVHLLKGVEPSYQMPPCKTFCSKIQQSCDLIKAKLKNVIKSEVYAMQCNTCSKNNYIGLSLTMFNGCKMETRLVAFSIFSNINELYISAIQEFALEGKIQGIVTCSAENIIEPFVKTECENELQDISRMPHHYRCLSHMLEQLIEDGLNKVANQTNTLLQKCSLLVEGISYSCKATELLEDYKISQIPMKNSTKWDSTYATLNVLLKTEEAGDGLLKRVIELTSRYVSLTPTDLVMIKELVSILSPFASAMSLLKTDSQPTSGLVIPMIIGLEITLANCETKEFTFTVMKTVIQQGLQSCLNEILLNEHFLISAALDPRFKMKWVRNEEEESRARYLITSKCTRTSGNNVEDEDTIPSLFSNVLAFLNGNEELQAYLRTETTLTTDCIKFWQENQQTFPRLFTLHRKHHIVPATTAVVERAIDAAESICCDPMNRKTFECLVIANLNKDLL